jgi:hypothetical protein
MKDFNEEMKKQNEEILNVWRKMGLLAGLKEGSINEWRTAKSFDLMANYLMQNGQIRNAEAIALYAFPMIRKLLCTGKHRLHRIIEPEMLLHFLNEEDGTVGECFSHEGKPTLSKKGKYILDSIKNLINQDEFKYIGDMKIGDFLTEIYNYKHDDYSNMLVENNGNVNKEKSNDKVLKAVFAILDTFCDLEAFLLSVVTDTFKMRFIDKASESLEIGDVIEADDGKEYKITGFNKENGEAIIEETKNGEL